MPLKVYQGLKDFQRLNRSFKAYRPRLDIVANRGLRHDRADEIIGEDVRPHFLANEFWRFASQDIHLETDFDIPEIEFLTPPTSI